MQDQLIKVYASSGPNLYCKTSFWKGFVIQGSKKKSQLLCLFVKMAKKTWSCIHSDTIQAVTISSGRYLVKVLLLYKSFLLTPGTTQRDDTWSLKFHIEGKGKEI